MKKLVSFVLFAVMSFSLCLFFASCDIGKELTYGKKYVTKGESTNEAFVFNKDGTGTYEYFRSAGIESKASGTITFLWEETSDGAIHLLSTEVKYNEDHTADVEIALPTTMFYFSENMLYYSRVWTTSFSENTILYKYYLEGSNLYKQLYDED